MKNGDATKQNYFIYQNDVTNLFEMSNLDFLSDDPHNANKTCNWLFPQTDAI